MKSLWTLTNTFFVVVLIYHITHITICTHTSCNHPLRTESINLKTTSILQVGSIVTRFATSTIDIHSPTKIKVTLLFYTLPSLNLKSRNTTSTISIRISTGAIFRQLDTKCIHIQIIPRKTINTLFIIVVTLTIYINSHVVDNKWSLIINCCINLFRASSVDRFFFHVSISNLALGAISFLVPHGTMLDDSDTNVLPLCTALETL